MRTYSSTADERTPELSDYIRKTLIYFGPLTDTDHDAIIYHENELVPLGNVTGDGKARIGSPKEQGMSSLYTFDSNGTFVITDYVNPKVNGFEVSITNTNILNFDFDKNGINDLVYFYPNYDNSVLNIVLVKENSEESYTISKNLSDDTAQFDLINRTATFGVIGAVNHNDKDYLLVRASDVVIGSGSSIRNEYVMVYEYMAPDISDPNSTPTLSLLQLVQTGTGPGTPTYQLSHNEGGKFPNLLAAVGFKNVLVRSNTDPEFPNYLYDATPIDLNTLATPLNAFSQAIVFSIGDINGDGLTEWANRVNTYTYKILSYQVGDSFNTEIASLDRPTNFGQLPSLYSPFNPFLDFNNDGIDDFVYTFVNDDEFGQKYAIGVDEAGSFSLENEVSLTYPRSDYDFNVTLRTFGLGDITGNGLDDYAFYKTRVGANKIEFYEGGSNGTTPYHVMELGRNTVKDIVSGEFNQQGRRDFVILMTVFEYNQNSILNISYQEVRFYENASDLPYKTLYAENYLPGNYMGDSNFIGTIANAGDVNNDGFDDFLIAAPVKGNQPIGLYLGGTSMSTNRPDVLIDFPAESNGGFVYSFGWGNTLQGDVDLNGDGISDFLIGNVGEYNFSDQPNTNPLNVGVINIYYGKDGSSDFTEPDLKLKPDTSAHGNNISLNFFGLSEIAVGDFNGDGFQDLAAKSFNHYKNGVNNGVPGLHIFHGGPDFDGNADQIIPLLKEIHRPDLVGFGNEYIGISGRPFLSSIPDITGDGSDELVYIGPVVERNGSIFFGGDTLSWKPGAIIKAPNSSVGFNQNGAVLNAQYRLAIGEFEQEGVTSILVEQPADRNFRDTPAYMYEISLTTVSTEDEITSAPTQFKLEQNFPNPFNPTTNISFNIPSASNVNLTVYNLLGQKVATILDGFMSAGQYTQSFDASRLSSGVYIYRLEAAGKMINRKMTLIK